VPLFPRKVVICGNSLNSYPDIEFSLGIASCTLKNRTLDDKGIHGSLHILLFSEFGYRELDVEQCTISGNGKSCTGSIAGDAFVRISGWLTVTAKGFSIDQDTLIAKKAEVKTAGSKAKKITNLKISLVNAAIDFNDKELNDSNR
jgi:hypothetical protein